MPEAIVVPCEAEVEIPHVSVDASISVACRVKENLIGMPFSDIVTVTEIPSMITGGSFWGATVTFTVMVSDNEPSETRTTKLSVPL